MNSLKKILIFLLVSQLTLFTQAQLSDTLNYGPYGLWEAAADGKTKVVKTCIDRGIYVDVSDDYDVTALMLAAQEGHLDIVELLSMNGANINAISAFPEASPLMAAVKNYHIEVAEYLIRHGAEINYRDAFGMRSIHYAAEYGYYYICDMLIYYDAIIDEPDGYGNTPLYYALQESEIKLANLLVDNGADIKKTDSNGNTYLHLLAQGDSIELVNYLLLSPIDETATNNYGITALDVAIYNGNYNVMLKLQDEGMLARDSISPYFNTRTLAKYSKNSKVRKAIRKQKIPHIVKPYFQYIEAGFNLDFNLDDILMSGDISVYDSRYGIKVTAGGLFHPGDKWVLLPRESGTYLQLKESRWGVYAGLRKYIRFYPGQYMPIRFFVGINQWYTKANYEALSSSPAGNFTLVPQAGISIDFNHITNIEIYYSYCDLGMAKVTPNRVGLRISWAIDFRSSETNEQNKYIIRD